MSVYTLSVLRAGVSVVNFEIDEKTIYSKTLMGDHNIQCEVVFSSVLPIKIGDYIMYRGAKYTINVIPNITMDDVNFVYNITFEPEIYTLYDKKFKQLGAKTFTLLGNAALQLQLLIDNINTIDSGWSIGSVDSTDEKFINYDKDDCRTALSKIATEFNLEYDVVGKVITLKKAIGQVSAVKPFQVGQFNGLYTLKRLAVNDAGVITRAYGYGGTRNLDYTYRGGKKELVFQGEYLEKNVNLYPNVKEGDYVNEDIYPHRIGTITNVSTNLTTKVYTVADDSLDFDLNDYLQEGVPAKIVFTSGELSGQEFEIQSYNHPTRTITYKEFTDTNGNATPNSTYQAAVGDKYTLVDINMPQSYIDVAELQLRNETQQFLDENSLPQVMYELEIDEKYVRDNGLAVNAGDYLPVKDSRLGVDGVLRASQVSWPLVNEEEIKATISNFILDSTSVQVKAAILNNRQSITTIYRGNALESRRQTKNLSDLKNLVFDPDGDYFTEKIKPGSVETLYLSVGAKANDFNLSEVVIKANLAGNPNSIDITGGRLIHNSIEISGAGFIWNMTGITQSGLTSGTAYYLYAKCSKGVLTGTFELSSARINTEQIPGFYYFNVGVLYPVNAGYRDFEFTKGMAYLVGDTLTAGRIKSIDAQTYWDLTQGQFKLGDANAGMDWNVTTPNTLTIRGALVQNPGGATSNIPVFRGAYNSSATYFKGDTVQYNGSTWIYINNIPSSNQTPVNGSYWTQSAARGEDGTSVKIKGTVANSAALPMSGNEIGDGYITNDTGHLWMWNGSSWTDLGVIRGPQGETGPTGESIRIYFAKNIDPNNPPSLTQTFNPPGWSAAAPVVDDNIYLLDNVGNNIATSSGDLISVGLQYEYLWMIVEVLDSNGDFSYWTTPNRLTGIRGAAADYVEVRFAKSGSATIPPSLSLTDSNPSNWSTIAPSYGALEYLWKIYGDKSGATGQLKSSWNGPYRETALDGINGTSSYLHVRYSPNANGSGMGTSINTYIGTLVSSSPTASTNYQDYTWVRLMGAQGIPGAPGSNGQTTYLHIKYSNDAGASFTGNGGENVGDYLGQYTDFNVADSTNVGDYTWSKIKGDVGAQGPSGPLPTGGDVYSPGATYTGNNLRVSIVRYNDGTGEKAYVARTDAGSFSGVVPTNTSKWNSFGGQYESVATKLLFTQLALIENAIVRYVSTDVAGQKRVEINENGENNFKIKNAANEVLILGDDDCSLEGFAAPGGVVTPVYGPGFIVGNAANNSSSLSRKGVITTKNGNVQHQIGDTTIGGRVILDVEGGMTLNNISFSDGTVKNVKLKLEYAADAFGGGGQVLVLAAEII